MKVSVHMPAYNHEAFIAQAIESALAQQAKFDFEVVVSDDASSDGTAAIARALAAKSGGRVKLLEQRTNLGIWENDQEILRNCTGEYIAWLEGDDYWTSPLKLQSQVDLLDRNPALSCCFHWALPSDPERVPPSWRPGPPEPRSCFTIDDLLEHGHFVPSCTAVFRSGLARPAMEWTRATSFLEATYLARFALSGPIGFLDRQMAVFRCRPDGVYGKTTPVEQLESSIRLLRLIGRHLGLNRRASYRRGLARRLAELQSSRNAG